MHRVRPRSPRSVCAEVRDVRVHVDLGLHAPWNGPSVSGPELVEAFSRLGAPWLEPDNSLARHQPLDAVDVLNSLFDHRLALA